MQEIFFLLLPVAAFYGWYMGARNAYQKKQKKGNKLSRDYVKGLNFNWLDFINSQCDYKYVDHSTTIIVDSRQEFSKDIINRHCTVSGRWGSYLFNW